MAEHLTVRLSLSGPPTNAQLVGLRGVFPNLALMPPAELRTHLVEWPVCVVGSVAASDSGPLAERVAALDVGIEFVAHGDYQPDYVASLMPGPPGSWETSDTSLELVFCPSFSPEVVVRLWEGQATSRAQLVSLGVSIWVRRFNPPPWLRAKRRAVHAPGLATREEPPVPPERPHAECVAVASIGPLVDLALGLAKPASTQGIDGMTIRVTARRGTRTEVRELWSPGPDTNPEAFELLQRAHSLASEGLHEPQSRRRLEELHCALGLGLPMEDLGGTPRVVRLWGRLSVHEEPALRALVMELADTGGVLDLSDVQGFAGLLFGVFDAVSERICFVATKPWLASALARRGVAPEAIHETRATAVAELH